MVATGVIVTGTPLLTGMAPGLIEPVPFEKTAVRAVEAPAEICAAPAVKLVMTGGGTTDTLACAVTKVPAPLVTVSVYVVVAAGVTLTGTPLVTAIAPGL